MRMILLGTILLLAGCPDFSGGGSKDRREAPGDPGLGDTDPECRFCGVQGISCCPKTCSEVQGQPLNRYFCLYNLRCLPAADGGGEKICVD
jgi:hypothetical protein